MGFVGPEKKDIYSYSALYSTMAETTTIQINKETKTKLEALKEHKRETFDELISKLMVLIPEGDDEGKYTDEFRAGLLESLIDAKNGKYVNSKQLKKELGF